MIRERQGSAKPPACVQLKPVTAETKATGAQIAARAAQWAAEQMADPERLSEAIATAREAAAETGLTGRAADVWLAMFTVAALASPGHLEAACEAALELRLNRPATPEEEHDPLKDLEASLIDAGAFGSWGTSSPARTEGDGEQDEITAYVRANPWADLNYEEDDRP